MSSDNNDESGRKTSLLAQAKEEGALGKGDKMKSNRKTRPDYILPSESEETGVNSQESSWTFSSIGTGNWTMVRIFVIIALFLQSSLTNFPRIVKGNIRDELYDRFSLCGSYFERGRLKLCQTKIWKF